MNEDKLEQVIFNCLEEINKAKLGNYDTDDAEKSAAMFLAAQIELINYIEIIELQAKQTKNFIEQVEAEKYFEEKSNTGDKKMTEGHLGHLLAKNTDVIKSKNEAAMAEVKLKKWNSLLSSIKDGHLYFRSFSKKESKFN